MKFSMTRRYAPDARAAASIRSASSWELAIGF
jgi:hypothetical protein